MTSPSLTSQPVPQAIVRPAPPLQRYGVPALLLLITLISTTAVGERYMYNFRLGQVPSTSDEDILPYAWVLHHVSAFATGLPFSLTLIGILLAHEFGHYFACRGFRVKASLPYMLPAPSLSGTFGAVIRLRSRVPSRAALMVIGAAGPIAGFVVALFGVAFGLAASTYAAGPVMSRVQPPLVVSLIHTLMRSAHPLTHIVPHPILTASWIGLLITALNLIPAGQLDGGHIMYALSPQAHRLTSRLTTVVLLVLGLWCFVGWLVWGLILLLPGMRHPRVVAEPGLKMWQLGLAPVCAGILLLTGVYRPFAGFSLIEILRELPHRYF